MATVYLNGTYVPDSAALISPLDRGFTYGDGVYEVIRAFNPNPAWKEGMVTILEPDVRWSRCDIKVTSLIPNSFSAQRAKEMGAHEGLFVRDGVVQEATLSNFFAVFDGEVRTAPLSNYILPGITRATVLDLCREHGIPCRETPVFATELDQADEAFLTSTVYDVAPVKSIEGHALPTAPPVTDRIVGLFQEVVRRECF